MNKYSNLRIAAREIESLVDTKVQESLENEQKNEFKLNFRNIKSQLFAAVAVSMTSLIMGYSIAYVSSIIESLIRDFHLSNYQISLFASFIPIAAIFGGLCGGYLIEFIGRKGSFMLTNVCFLLAWLVCFFAQSYVMLCVGRIITGLSIGIASLAIPVYTAEILEPEIRGFLGLIPNILANIGILICFIFGFTYQWKGLALIGAALCIPSLIMIWFIPETPKFLLGKGQLETARKSLQWLREKNINIETEFADLQKLQEESIQINMTILGLFSKRNIKLLIVPLGLMFFQQFSGINVIIFYTTLFFEESGLNLDAQYITVVISVISLGTIFIASILIDKLGRKVLLYTSSISMIVPLIAFAIYYYLKEVTQANVSGLGWFPLVNFVIYLVGFSLGYGPIPWLMMGEILPSRIRGPTASIVTSFNWILTFIVIHIFMFLTGIIQVHYIFLIYGGIVIISLFFTHFLVPETGGISLADIERKLTHVKSKRPSYIVDHNSLPDFVE